MTKEERRQISETILAQLGGKRFAMMTGANSFMHDDNGSLIFKLPAKQHGLAHFGVRIELNAMDTYDMHFLRMKRGASAVVETTTHEGIYNDQLQTIFTKETGLYTRF